MPDHDLESTPEKKKITKAANEAVFEILSPKRGVKRKRESYGHYDSEQRAKIAKHACEHGNASAVRHFSKVLERSINESTVRYIKKQYLETVKNTETNVVTLPAGKRGRPTLLGKYASDVLDYIKKLRQSGSVVNKHILLAGATGIVQEKAKHLLRENGGPLNFDRPWAESFLRRHGFVRRKQLENYRLTLMSNSQNLFPVLRRLCRFSTSLMILY